MINLFNKIFKSRDSKNYFYKDFENLNKKTNIEKIFSSISNFSEKSEIRYVGGSIRKIINKEKIDDIDLATNITPVKVCEILKKNNISFYESGIAHGTITAKVNDYKFEITTLRKDMLKLSFLMIGMRMLLEEILHSMQFMQICMVICMILLMERKI